MPKKSLYINEQKIVLYTSFWYCIFPKQLASLPNNLAMPIKSPFISMNRKRYFIPVLGAVSFQSKWLFYQIIIAIDIQHIFIRVDKFIQITTTTTTTTMVQIFTNTIFKYI